MTIVDSIKTRRSTRSYSGTALSNEHKQLIRDYIAGLPQPLKGNARIELVSRNNSTKSEKLGTYGFISGAMDYLILVHDNAKFAGENAGYLFEQVVLFCTTLGLGTCWVGGTFKASDFVSRITLNKDEALRIISPVGYPFEKLTLRDRLIRTGVGSNKRKPFGKLFFADENGSPLGEDFIYAPQLEMVRIAPSAHNIQPWRVVADGTKLHFYSIGKLSLNDIDLGIALCHFNESCREAGIDGYFTDLKKPDLKIAEEMKYCITWIRESEIGSQ